VVAHDAVQHPQTRVLAETYLRPLGIGAMLDVPVWLHGRLVGVLCHEHVGGVRQWTPEEVDFAGSMAAMISLSHEAAQRARSEAALRQSEERFRRLFESSSTGVILHDDKQYLDVNPAMVRMLGYQSAAELIGKNPVETSPPIQPGGVPSAELAHRHIQNCLERGSARFDWVALRADGAEIQIEVILTRIELNGRHFIQAIVNDISERKRAEAELQRALAHERELSQLKSNFVSMVSHEFRTPLGIIMSSAEILKDYLETLEPAEREEHLASIARNSKRMSELMEEVLVLGRLDAGKMQFDPAPVDFAALCGRLADEVRSATDDACPIQLRTEGLHGEAKADERLLRHVLVNLLVNAVKYSEPGTPVEFVVRREGPDAVCEIRDRGIGIPEKDQALLFQAFQGGGNVGQRPGTGLGLVIVKRGAELHGVTLDLRSAVGQGTTVTVRIPVFTQSRKRSSSSKMNRRCAGTSPPSRVS
jgi:PAS domain S-box-containing protein